MARRDDDDDIPETPKVSKAESRSLLVAPGAAFQVMAYLSIATFIVDGFYVGANLAIFLHETPFRLVPWQVLVVPALRVVFAIIGIGVQISIAILAGKMKRSTSYKAAMACAILALIPCCSPVIYYLNYLSLGILCLIFLFDERVRKCFRS